VITALLLILAGYFSGSLPFGVWVARSKGIDITKMGSGSTGATNVYRCVGKKEGILVLFLDALKGYLPVTAAIFLDHGSMSFSLPLGSMTFVVNDLVPCIAGAVSVIGHSKSIFLKFTGGKSAATGLGTTLALSPAAGALLFGTFVALVYFTRIVSVASIVASIAVGFYMALFQAPPTVVCYGALGGLFVIIRHKANIVRLINGTEPRFGQKATDIAAAAEAAKDSAKDAASRR
jgi:acyl phosphate:glycerol-3-phosphate acyltransferase